ncbi:hypothetical protein N7456_012939 [Penicillium angulare]|uniref:Uncharacterized protein n=1 Tax=Penicillium angulare TaxID=116970 RepID=A0A9W9EKK5_9EURO|nr:hypothetical protein N7456_012939 [Penicillium angulare]
MAMDFGDACSILDVLSFAEPLFIQIYAGWCLPETEKGQYSPSEQGIGYPEASEFPTDVTSGAL